MAVLSCGGYSIVIYSDISVSLVGSLDGRMDGWMNGWWMGGMYASADLLDVVLSLLVMI